MNSKCLRLTAEHVMHLSVPLGKLVPLPGWGISMVAQCAFSIHQDTVRA
jgi:hypothetical protein